MKPSLRLRARMAIKIWWAGACEHYMLGVRFRTFAPRIAATVVSLGIIFVVGTTSIYAYSRDKVTRGDMLYPIKLLIEELRIQVSFTPEQKTQTYLSLAHRRTAEAKIKAKEGHIDAVTLSAAKQNQLKAVEAARSIESQENKEEAKTQIAVAASTQSINLETVKEAGVNLEASAKELEVLSDSLNDELIIISAAIPENNGITVSSNVVTKKEETVVGNNDSAVATSIDENLIEEKELIESSSDLQVLEDLIETMEENSDTDKLDVLLQIEDPVMISNPIKPAISNCGYRCR